MVHQIWRPFPIIEKGLSDVKDLMRQSVRVPLPEIETSILQYIEAPGKYIRSGLCLISCQALACNFDQDMYKSAAALEFLHLATLIHDDVIDQANVRRGIATMHQTQSNKIAIYSGDYLLALSARLMAESGIKPQEGYSNSRAIEQILFGELRQLRNINRADMTMMDYLRQIQGKTAVLFGLALVTPALKTSAKRRQLKRLYNAGLMMGMYFQLRDDLIDYQQALHQTGKPQLQDIHNGIFTAPYLLLKDKVGDLTHLDDDDILKLMEEQHIYKQVTDLAEAYLQKAYKQLDLAQVQTQVFRDLFEQLKVI
ncbi:TPA: polyprenyl synthetase family protein [Streptococcus suis]